MTMDALKIIAIRLMKKRARRFYWARMASHSTSIEWETRTSFTFSLEVFVMKWIYTPVLVLTIAALLGSVQPAAAHHSGSGVNSGKIVELNVKVKEFQVNNPHTWIQIVVDDGTGKITEGSLKW